MLLDLVCYWSHHATGSNMSLGLTRYWFRYVMDPICYWFQYDTGSSMLSVPACYSFQYATGSNKVLVTLCYGSNMLLVPVCYRFQHVTGSNMSLGLTRYWFQCLSQYLTNLMHKICFTVSFISCLYMFRAHMLIIRRLKLHYTASGIITPIGGRLVHDTGNYRCDEHMCSSKFVPMCYRF